MSDLLPPAARSGPALTLIPAAAHGRFDLQRCGGCGSFLYPMRDACPVCLSDDLDLQTAPPGGTLLSETMIRITADPFFRSRPALRQGLVRADCGVTMIAILHRDCSPGGRVRLALMLDRGGQPVVHARPETAAAMAEDPHLRDLTMTPMGRCVLIDDPHHPLTRPLIGALRAAGASEVLSGLPDTRDHAAVAARVDIVIATGDPAPLIKAFGPAMAARDDAGVAGWVLVQGPGAPDDAGTAQRAQMALQGLRVMTAVPGAAPPDSMAEALVGAMSEGLRELRLAPNARR